MLLRAYGIARSLVMYYGIPGKHRRARRLYGEFLGAATSRSTSARTWAGACGCGAAWGRA
ncbi:hypothetical protein [Actinomadura madurae]|uniref:hypothetical protein n=1 Tax=Actinomadura madurae TaxID=1993 RepID=UPI0020D2377F|nr:hypothetical protein [Actinomadura madurae]MCP9984426.1 hypothetical protein [Actinomadura madurae]MCQ0004021.1 hypothetical protein [Actinomadura madurae]